MEIIFPVLYSDLFGKPGEGSVFRWPLCPQNVIFSAGQQQEAWGGRSSWKVQHQQTHMQSASARARASGIRKVTGQSEWQSEPRPVTLRKSATHFHSEQVQIKSCILSLNIFIETLRLRYLNYILAVLQEPCCPEPIDAHISRPNERQNGDGGINGSVPNFPQPPSSNQII